MAINQTYVKSAVHFYALEHRTNASPERAVKVLRFPGRLERDAWVAHTPDDAHTWRESVTRRGAACALGKLWHAVGTGTGGPDFGGLDQLPNGAW